MLCSLLRLQIWNVITTELYITFKWLETEICDSVGDFTKKLMSRMDITPNRVTHIYLRLALTKWELSETVPFPIHIETHVVYSLIYDKCQRSCSLITSPTTWISSWKYFLFSIKFLTCLMSVNSLATYCSFSKSKSCTTYNVYCK